MKKLLLSLFILISPIVKGEWFVGQTGLPTVVGNRGELSAIINYRSDGFLGLYFYSRTGSFACSGTQQIDQVESMLVNNTLVRFSRSCDGHSAYYYASTIQGKEYLVREFAHKTSVIFHNSRGVYIDTLSAKGFIKMSNLMGATRGVAKGGL